MPTPSKKKEAYIYLESQITTNPFLKHQFEVMETIKNGKNSVVSDKQLASFIKGVKAKNSSFIKENKVSHLGFWKANKALLEYFNINPKELSISAMDTAIDVYATSKGLNESAFKQLISKKIGKKDRILAEKVEFRKKIHEIKENFVHLINENDTRELKKQFKIINFLSECMPTNKKLMVQQSALALFTEHKKNPAGCAKKLFKLRVITEKIADEEYDDDVAEKEIETPQQEKAFNKINDEIKDYHRQRGTTVDDEEVPMRRSPGKTSGLMPGKYISGSTIKAPINANSNPDMVILTFTEIPFYPMGIARNAAQTTALKIKQKLNRMERAFMNLFIYQKNRDELFNPVNAIWHVKMLEQCAPGARVPAKITVYLSTNGQHTWDEYVRAAQGIVKDFDNALPDLMDDLYLALTPSKTLRPAPNEIVTSDGRTKGGADRNLLDRSINNKNDKYEQSREDNFGGLF
jgi:hypothetical protein